MIFEHQSGRIAKTAELNKYVGLNSSICIAVGIIVHLTAFWKRSSRFDKYNKCLYNGVFVLVIRLRRVDWHAGFKL